MRLFRHYFLLFIVSFSALHAQEGFYYQAVIKNPDGSPLKETQVEVKISIATNTSILYTEQRSIQTSREGFVSFIIGASDPSSFSNINWGQDLFLEDQIDVNDGQGFSTPSRMPLLKSPRAYVADRAISVIDNSITTNGILNQTILNEDISDSAAISFSKLSISFSDIEGLGALMDTEVTNLADVKAFDPTAYATAAQGTTADNALQAASNLSDLADAATARNSLGIYSGVYEITVNGAAEPISVSDLIGLSALAQSATIIFHSNEPGLVVIQSVLEDSDFDTTLDTIRVSFSANSSIGDKISYIIIP